MTCPLNQGPFISTNPSAKYNNKNTSQTRPMLSRIFLATLPYLAAQAAAISLETRDAKELGDADISAAVFEVLRVRRMTCKRHACFQTWLMPLTLLISRSLISPSRRQQQNSRRTNWSRTTTSLARRRTSRMRQRRSESAAS